MTLTPTAVSWEVSRRVAGGPKPSPITLMDLVDAVNDAADTEEEAMAAVVDLLLTGRARFATDPRPTWVA